VTQSRFANLDQTRMRIGGTLRHLVERESLQSDGGKCSDVALCGIDDGARADAAAS